MGAIETAEKIARNSTIAVKLCAAFIFKLIFVQNSRNLFCIGLCKKAIQRSCELSLSEGCRYERELFYGTFATQDRREGMIMLLQSKNVDIQFNFWIFDKSNCIS